MSSFERSSSESEQVRDVPSFIEPRPPLVTGPGQRPRPVHATNLMDLYECESETEDDDVVKVYLRVKPSPVTSSLYEIRSDTLLVTSADVAPSDYNRRTQCNISKQHTFSHIFRADATQKQVFDHAVKSNLRKLTEGQSFTLLTYGASGSGKTYTLMGTEEQPGLIPRSLEYIFKLVSPAQHPQHRPRDAGVETLTSAQQAQELELVSRLRRATPPVRPARRAYRRMSHRLTGDFHSVLSLAERNTHYVWVSFLEIYNEAVYDLLQRPDRSKLASKPPTKLRICEDPRGTVYVKGATQAFVRTGAEAYDVMSAGRQNVRVAATGVHAHSSRSHCIFTITLLSETPEGVVSSYVRLCDLAGSERAERTQNAGVRMAESRAINSSLHVLERCLHMLRRKQRAAAADVTTANLCVPFRESKLTRLLGAPLSGASCEAVSMVVTVNPSPLYAPETRHVLQLVAIASDICINSTTLDAVTLEMSVDSTADTRDAEILTLKADNERLHFEMGRLYAQLEKMNSEAVREREKSTKTMEELVHDANKASKDFFTQQMRLQDARHAREKERFMEQMNQRINELIVENNKLIVENTKLKEQVNQQPLKRALAESELEHLHACLAERDHADSPEGDECKSDPPDAAVVILDEDTDSSTDDESESDSSLETITEEGSNLESVRNTMNSVNYSDTMNSEHNTMNSERDTMSSERNTIDEAENVWDGTRDDKPSALSVDDTNDDIHISNAVHETEDDILTRLSADESESDDDDMEIQVTKLPYNSASTLKNSEPAQETASDTVNNKHDKGTSNVNAIIHDQSNINYVDEDISLNESFCNSDAEAECETSLKTGCNENDEHIIVEGVTITENHNNSAPETKYVHSVNEKQSKLENVIRAEKSTHGYAVHDLCEVKDNKPQSKPETIERVEKSDTQKDRTVVRSMLSINTSCSDDITPVPKLDSSKTQGNFTLDSITFTNVDTYETTVTNKKSLFNIPVEIVLTEHKLEGTKLVEKMVSGDTFDPPRVNKNLEEIMIDFSTQNTTITKDTFQNLSLSKIYNDTTNKSNVTETIKCGDVNTGGILSMCRPKSEVWLTQMKQETSLVYRKTYHEPTIPSNDSFNKQDNNTVDLENRIDNDVECEKIKSFDDGIVNHDPTKLNAAVMEDLQNQTSNMSINTEDQKSESVDKINDSNKLELSMNSERQQHHNESEDYEICIKAEPVRSLNEDINSIIGSIDFNSKCKRNIEDLTQQSVDAVENVGTIKRSRSLKLRKKAVTSEESKSEHDESRSSEKNSKRSMRKHSKLRDIANLQKEFSDVTMGLACVKKEVPDIPSPEKREGEENVPPTAALSCPAQSTRSRRKLWTPRAEPLDESVASDDDGNLRVRIPRPSYHRTTRVRRKL